MKFNYAFMGKEKGIKGRYSRGAGFEVMTKPQNMFT